MTPSLRFSARYWIAGIALAAAGVSANRLLAPLLDVRPRAIVAVAGELIALAGLAVIVLGINRRLRHASEFAGASTASVSAKGPLVTDSGSGARPPFAR